MGDVRGDTGDRRQVTGDKRRDTGDMRWETGEGRQERETGDGKQDSRIQETRDGHERGFSDVISEKFSASGGIYHF